MAQHEEIVLWLNRRWKNAIEKHLKGETLQEHLETVRDALCNQLPQSEYERISHEIYAEDAANREAEEAARTYAAYHVMENGKEWYCKTSPGEELLEVGKKLRQYMSGGKGTAPDLFVKMLTGGHAITAEEYDALTAMRMENTGKVRGVFDVNFNEQEFSAVHIYRWLAELGDAGCVRSCISPSTGVSTGRWSQRSCGRNCSMRTTHTTT